MVPLPFMLRSPALPLHSGVSSGKWHRSMYEIAEMTFHFSGKKYLQWILVRLLAEWERSFGDYNKRQGTRSKSLAYLYINKRQHDDYNVCVHVCMHKCTSNVHIQMFHYYLSILTGIFCGSSIRQRMSPLFTVLKYRRLMYCSDLRYYNKIYKMIW